jgi:hypothetical protein
MKAASSPEASGYLQKMQIAHLRKLAAAVGVDPTTPGFKGPTPRRWCRIKLDLRAGAAPALPG